MGSKHKDCRAGASILEVKKSNPSSFRQLASERRGYKEYRLHLYGVIIMNEAT